jgi:hypothetical protein
MCKLDLYDDTKEPMNKKVRTVLLELYELRKLECKDISMKDKLKKASKHISSITNNLLKYNDYLLYRPLWEELHDRMVYYYNHINEVNLKSKIPFFQTTLHNETVYWWKKAQEKNKLKGTLVHFDSHPDMNVPGHSARKVLKDKKIIVNKFFKYSICGEIGSPVTCLMLMKASNNVIWGMPNWLYDENGEYDQYLVSCKNQKDSKCRKNELTYLRSDKSPIDPWGTEEHNSIKRVPDKLIKPKNFTFFHKFKYNRLHFDTINTWKHMEKIMGSEKKFIMDIDLDFFVCNGEKLSKKEYMKELGDIRSPYRTTGMPEIYTPRQQYDTKTGDKIDKMLIKEMSELKKRIDKFLNGLKYLKKEGITPSVINISDSTPSLFSGDINRAVFNNNYTPKYFVPYIHLLLIKGLHKLYGNSFTSMFS